VWTSAWWKIKQSEAALRYAVKIRCLVLLDTHGGDNRLSAQ